MPRLTPQQLAELLRKQVRTYLPGTRLPGRRALAAQFGVTPHVVRQAIALLTRQGVIRSRAREGMVVAAGASRESISRVIAFIQQPGLLFQQQILLGADKACTARRLRLEVLPETPDLTRPDCLARIANGQYLSIGWMFIDIVPPDQTLLAWRIEGVTVVQVDSYSRTERANLVTLDVQRAIYQATVTLLRLGHRRIGYVGPMLPHDTVAQLRLRGYELALRGHDAPFDPSLILSDPGVPGRTGRVVHEMLERPDRPTALVTANQRMGCEAIVACDGLGLRLAHDVSIIAGGTHLRQSLPNADRLSCFDEGSPEELGRSAVEVLLQSRDSSEPISILLGSQWIDRGSAGPPPKK